LGFLSLTLRWEYEFLHVQTRRLNRRGQASRLIPYTPDLVRLFDDRKNSVHAELFITRYWGMSESHGLSDRGACITETGPGVLEAANRRV